MNREKKNAKINWNVAELFIKKTPYGYVLGYSNDINLINKYKIMGERKRESASGTKFVFEWFLFDNIS